MMFQLLHTQMREGRWSGGNDQSNGERRCDGVKNTNPNLLLTSRYVMKLKLNSPKNSHVVIVCVFCLISLEDGGDVDQDGLTVKKSRIGKDLILYLIF